jgi:hypothetical protein
MSNADSTVQMLSVGSFCYVVSRVTLCISVAFDMEWTVDCQRTESHIRGRHKLI